MLDLTNRAELKSELGIDLVSAESRQYIENKADHGSFQYAPLPLPTVMPSKSAGLNCTAFIVRSRPTELLLYSAKSVGSKGSQRSRTAVLKPQGPHDFPKFETAGNLIPAEYHGIATPAL